MKPNTCSPSNWNSYSTLWSIWLDGLK